MTNDERRWRTGTDPLALLKMRHPMRTLGSAEPQSRRSRMYLIACARRPAVWDRLPGVCRALVALAETFADAPIERESLRATVAPIAERLMNSAREATDLLEAHHELAVRGQRESDSTRNNLPFTPDECHGFAALVYLPFDTHMPNFAWAPPALHDVRLVREVYGNPYRRVPFEPEWRTDTVLSLARDMYDRREFSAMPILADALQDAGCNSPDILDHCRDANQLHARGCWVLDLVLNLK